MEHCDRLLLLQCETCHSNSGTGERVPCFGLSRVLAAWDRAPRQGRTVDLMRARRTTVLDCTRLQAIGSSVLGELPHNIYASTKHHTLNLQCAGAQCFSRECSRIRECSKQKIQTCSRSFQVQQGFTHIGRRMTSGTAHSPARPRSSPEQPSHCCSRCGAHQGHCNGSLLTSCNGKPAGLSIFQRRPATQLQAKVLKLPDACSCSCNEVVRHSKMVLCHCGALPLHCLHSLPSVAVFTGMSNQTQTRINTSHANTWKPHNFRHA